MISKSKEKLAIAGVFLLIFGWWISDIPIGYYQFKRMCEEEGGLRSNTQVKSGEGWLVKYESDARDIVSRYSTVPFARYRADDGIWRDVRYKGGNPGWSESYTITPADESLRPRYRLQDKFELVADAIRLHKSIYTLNDELLNKIVFQTTQFTFTWTVPENTLLGRSDTEVCPDYKAVTLSVQSFLKSTYQAKE